MPKIFKQPKFTILKFLCPWYSFAITSLRYSKILLNFFSFWSKRKMWLVAVPCSSQLLAFTQLVFISRGYSCVDHHQEGGLIFHFSHINLNKGNFRKEEQPQIYLKFDRVTYLVLNLFEDSLIFLLKWKVYKG